MDAETPGFIRSGTNDGPFSPPRHNDRFAAQLWIVPLLDGGIECVHVHMDDLADAHLAYDIPMSWRNYSREIQRRLVRSWEVVSGRITRILFANPSSAKSRIPQ